MDDMDPLQMATDQELLAEVARRYPTGVFGGESVFSGVHGDKLVDRGRVIAWGSPTVCLGIVHKLVLMTDLKAMAEIEDMLRREGDRDADAEG